MKNIFKIISFLLLLTQPLHAATFYLDYEGGNDANDGTTFANRWKTFTSGATAARIAPGDTIRVMASKDATSLGQSASWTNLSRTVTLTSAVTANISTTESNWTCAANVTCTVSTTNKEGTNAQSMAIAAGFTTGKVAHFQISSTDFSAYKQVSFWIRPSATSATQTFQIKLCSDTSGNTPVDTLQIPALVGANQWRPHTIDKGSALGATIQSVAIYADAVDPGTVTLLLDNVLAVKDSTSADSLSLTSLIGKNTGNETWYGIQSINGTTVKLDVSTNSDADSGDGYSGTTESVTTYKRETIKTDQVSSSNTAVGTINDSGTLGSLITFSGGWNRTDMSTQTGQTWFDGQNGMGLGLQYSGKSYNSLEKIALVRYGTGINLQSSSAYNAFSEILAVNNNTTNGMAIASSQVNDFTTIVAANCNGSDGINASSSDGLLFGTIHQASGNGGDGMELNSCSGHQITTSAVFNNESGFGMRLASSINNVFYNVTFNDEVPGGIIGSPASEAYFYSPVSNTAFAVNALSSRFYLFNANLTGSETSVGSQQASLARVVSVKNDQTADQHKIEMGVGTIYSGTSVRHTASGISWEIKPTNSDEVRATRPMIFSLGKVAVNASSLVTASVWLRRTNTAITGKLRIRGGQIAGVSADVEDDITAVANTWEQQTITFTPSEAGVVEIEVIAYGGTTHTLYVDDFSVSQA
jgi:hypothetical protein